MEGEDELGVLLAVESLGSWFDGYPEFLGGGSGED